ncbi:terpene synthase family protein [Streptomyces desertarenae]|uniref:Terpene synthase n=1 Tax=Streptomyces desertarenae TaxID=2666184 RepID=A0ABW4PQ67_9ACTN
MDTTAVDLPPFYCPIEPAVHPRVDEVERRAVEWIDRFGFCGTGAERARVLGSNSAEFYARFAPEADLERLWITACWVYWGFAIDDARCDEGALSADPAAFSAMAGRVQRALELPGPRDFDDPYAAAVHDLGERFRACATPVQVRRFQQAHRAWLAGVQWQVGNRARGHMPTLDDYLTMRLHSAGGEPTYAMLEIANDAEVPAREMDSPAVCALTEMAILVAALDNDRHSFAREVGRRQAEQNVFAVLMRQDGSPLAQAMEDAVALRDRVLCRFLDLRDRVLPRASRELHRYLTDLGHGIRGNIDWGSRAPRYLGPQSAGAEPGGKASPGRAAWSDRPLNPGEATAPPSIAWWWEDLTF